MRCWQWHNSITYLRWTCRAHSPLIALRPTLKLTSQLKLTPMQHANIPSRHRSLSRDLPCVRRTRCASVIVRAQQKQKTRTEADVVVVGAGIIGLLTARALLQQRLSVVMVERKQLCAGATGAGQGYIWMAHRSPGTVGWALADWSRQLWREQVAADSTLRDAVEWQEVGSLLLATNEEEAQQLQQRQQQLQHHGVPSQLCSAEEVRRLEPALHLPDGGAGLLALDDAQINGRRTAHTLLEQCRAQPGFTSLLETPVVGLHLDQGMPLVETEDRVLHGRLGTVVTAGVWSGAMLADTTGHEPWRQVLQPRRGHLLELQPPAGMPPVKTGMMEMSYTKHYSAPGHSTSASGSDTDKSPVDITFTATTSASGSLLVGSSREFSGWGNESSPGIIDAILQRAALFLPDLACYAAPGTHDDVSTRVGLRPFATGGLPIIGPVPGAQGLFVAAGHEGSGLCLGPATAQLLLHCITGAGTNPQEVQDFAALRPEQRVPGLGRKA